MSSSVCLEIAGVPFSIRGPSQAALPDPRPSYQTFFRAFPAAGAGPRIELELDLGAMPDLAGLERLFDGPTWSLHRQGTDYLFSLTPAAPGAEPGWIAVVDSSFSKGRVYCHKAPVRRDGGTASVANPVLHRLDQLLLMCVLAPRDGAIVHAAGAGVRGHGVVFGGRSGAGKSTVARLLEPLEKEGHAERLSDDRVVIRHEDGGMYLYGTPWSGDAEIARNRRVPLRRILFLRKAARERLVRLSPAEAVERLIPLVSIPWYDPDMITCITSFCDRLAGSVPAYDFFFTPAPAAADFIAAEMAGGA